MVSHGQCIWILDATVSMCGWVLCSVGIIYTATLGIMWYLGDVIQQSLALWIRPLFWNKNAGSKWNRSQASMCWNEMNPRSQYVEEKWIPGLNVLKWMDPRLQYVAVKWTPGLDVLKWDGSQASMCWNEMTPGLNVSKWNGSQSSICWSLMHRIIRYVDLNGSQASICWS